MSLGGPGGESADVVSVLRAVPGVADAEILPDEHGGPGTLRLQLALGADEVDVAMKVNRILGERFGLGVDAGRVQVVEEAMPNRGAHVAATPAVQAAVADVEERIAAVEAVAGPELSVVPSASATEPPAGGSPAQPVAAAAPPQPAVEPPAAEDGPTHAPRPPRLLISRMQLVSAQLGVAAEVSLTRDGRSYTGAADAAATATSVHRAVAQATLRAVESCIGSAARFELEHLQSTTLGADKAVVVEISMITRHATERLTGISAVRDDPRQAVIRATLDALNRRIETYLQSA
ncbi:MAG TPA: hypothetical protein VIM19_05020 [Actinomycetes bacterium]